MQYNTLVNRKVACSFHYATRPNHLQSRLYKNHKICIFLNRDYVCFTKMYYLCNRFQKQTNNN